MKKLLNETLHWVTEARTRHQDFGSRHTLVRLSRLVSTFSCSIKAKWWNQCPVIMMMMIHWVLRAGSTVELDILTWDRAVPDLVILDIILTVVLCVVGNDTCRGNRMKIMISIRFFLDSWCFLTGHMMTLLSRFRTSAVKPDRAYRFVFFNQN